MLVLYPSLWKASGRGGAAASLAAEPAGRETRSSGGSCGPSKVGFKLCTIAVNSIRSNVINIRSNVIMTSIILLNIFDLKVASQH